ncbi:hypothetical protein [Rubidibacter lacunae]|uniref:hypothetical protein n=1 Tax=Rubidibacter lacunae TaxID=582514 RepID=UPI00059161A0|nr:hypothetical protein [Rubidibacter lacunae]
MTELPRVELLASPQLMLIGAGGNRRCDRGSEPCVAQDPPDCFTDMLDGNRIVLDVCKAAPPSVPPTISEPNPNPSPDSPTTPERQQTRRQMPVVPSTATRACGVLSKHTWAALYQHSL